MLRNRSAQGKTLRNGGRSRLGEVRDVAYGLWPFVSYIQGELGCLVM